MRHYYIQNVKDGIHVRVDKISKEKVKHFSKFMSATVKKISRKAQAQFREKLGKSRLRQNGGFLIKKRVFELPIIQSCSVSWKKPALLQRPYAAVTSFTSQFARTIDDLFE